MEEASSSKRGSVDDPTNSKRSRGLGLVTPNACTECRKKRAKCDGKTPCGRCSSQRDVECVYEVPIRQSKENMRNEIEHLRRYQLHTEKIMAALATQGRAEAVLELLRRGETLEYISQSIERSIQSNSSMTSAHVTTYEQASDQEAVQSALQPAQSTIQTPLMALKLKDAVDVGMDTRFRSENASNMGWQSDPSPMDWASSNVSSMSPQIQPVIGSVADQTSGYKEVENAIRQARDHGQGTILGPEFSNEEQSIQQQTWNKSWTNVTDDADFVEHLMTLYFCWEYPTFASLSKEHFLHDFRLGSERFCSSLLVNCILALGCRFSTQARARINPEDSNTAGDHFFFEATRILEDEEDRHVLTTVQALGLMAIREASCGRSSESVFLSGQAIRIAIEMGLQFENGVEAVELGPKEKAVRAATFWGAFSLDQAWSLSIGRLPRFSRDIKLVSKPDIIDHVEKSSWVAYTDDGAPLERNCTQPSNVRSVFKTFCELSEIVHQHLYLFYTPGRSVQGKLILEIYTKYLIWYEDIPSALRLGQNFTPAVLFAHMYYHYAILLLFRPFIKLNLTESSVSPSEVCNQAAAAISALVNSYSRLYTLRRTPSFVPYFVLTSSITHLVEFGKNGSGPEKVLQGVADLKEMKACHGFAYRAYNIIRFLIMHWEIDIDIKELDGDEKHIDPKTLARPSPTSTNYFAPYASTSDMMTDISAIEGDDANPLFWPFPLQGRPMLHWGVLLASAGFAVASSVA